MTDLQPLTILLEHSERARDGALAAHRRAEAASAAATAQAEQLRGYRRDYEQRWSAQFRREGKIELVQCYQSFVERLTLAVEQQTQIAEHAAQQAAQALIVLRGAELRCASVRKLIERRVLEDRLLADRRDRRQSDDSAARAAWARLAATRPAPLM